MKKATSDPKKLRELIVYISKKCSGDLYYGITKLNKILYYSDSEYYLKKGKTISGNEYIHLPHGPVVQDMHKIIEQMKMKDIAISLNQIGTKTQKKPVALREPDLSSFDPEMISMLDEVIDFFCNKNKIRASWLSDATHLQMGWRATRDNEVIPMNTYFLKSKTKQKYNSWEKLHAKEISKQLAGQYGFPAS